MEMDELPHIHWHKYEWICHWNLSMPCCKPSSFSTMPHYLHVFLCTPHGSENARWGNLLRVSQVVGVVSRQDSRFSQSLAFSFLYSSASEMYKGISAALIWFNHHPIFCGSVRTSFLPCNLELSLLCSDSCVSSSGSHCQTSVDLRGDVGFLAPH